MSLKKACGSLLLAAMAVFGLAALADAAEQPQQWNLVVPDGVIEQAQIAPAPRLTDLAGKTIVLRWNGKHNGDIVLDRLAELLTEKYPTATIHKAYVDDPSLNGVSGNVGESRRVADVVKAYNPDIVIASQAD